MSRNIEKFMKTLPSNCGSVICANCGIGRKKWERTAGCFMVLLLQWFILKWSKGVRVIVKSRKLDIYGSTD